MIIYMNGMFPSKTKVNLIMFPIIVCFEAIKTFGFSTYFQKFFWKSDWSYRMYLFIHPVIRVQPSLSLLNFTSFLSPLNSILFIHCNPKTNPISNNYPIYRLRSFNSSRYPLVSRSPTRYPPPLHPSNAQLIQWIE